MEDAARNEYPARLMNVLGRATTLRYRIEVCNNLFHVTTESNGYDYVRKLAYEYTLDSDVELDVLLREIEQRELELTVANQRLQARKVALAKLTDEEIALLGL